MSEAYPADESPTTFTPGETEPEEWIRENRDLIEWEANSDASDAWVFQAFLDSLESEDSDG